MSHTMPVRANTVFVSRSEWDSGTITAIGGIIVAIITAIFGGGFWQWWTGRKKVDADAQTVIIDSFKVIIGKLETERNALVERVVECDRENHKLHRRNMVLERTLMHNQIDLPPNDVGGRHER